MASRGLSAAFVKLALLLISSITSLHSHPLHASRALAPMDDAPEEEPGSPAFWWKTGVSIALILGGGVFAGLTIGLMGQDVINLQVLVESGEEHERKHAAKVLSLLKRGKHWVLVTLLLSNVLTNETLPIIMDSILPGGFYAIAISTASIVIFGEVIPQSLCVRYGLAIGAFLVPPVLVLMWIMYPIAYPIAKLLDYLLGDDEGTVYKKAGLKTLVTLHKTLGVDRLNEDEVTIITAVLDLKDKSVASIMTPIEDVFIMAADTILDERMVDTILKEGYSRIPVYEPGNPTNFVGMLLVKILITYDPEDCVPVSNFTLATLPECSPKVSCLDILNFFQEGKSHMVLVSDSPGEPSGALGLLTCEDIIEELIGEEILDETDVYIDVHAKLKRTSAPTIRKGHRVNYTQLDRKYASLAAQGQRASFKPANVAADPLVPRSNKVTIKSNRPDGGTASPARPAPTDTSRSSPINERTGLRPPGHPDRSNEMSGYGSTTERSAIARDLSRSPSERKQGSGAEEAAVDSEEEIDDHSHLAVAESSSDRRKSRVRSGSIVETSFVTDDGTTRVVVEAAHRGHDHSTIEEEEECEVLQQRNGIRVPKLDRTRSPPGRSDSRHNGGGFGHGHRREHSHLSSARSARASSRERLLNGTESSARDAAASGGTKQEPTKSPARDDSGGGIFKRLLFGGSRPTTPNKAQQNGASQPGSAK